MAMGDDRDRVREAADIVDVVGECLALKPKGREFVGLCPFHDDHRPSMCVVPAKQIFHCFSCGAGGDVFTFVQRYHSMEFREALTFLAERAGIELTRARDLGDLNLSGGNAGPSRAELLSLNGVARDFFRTVLGHEQHGQHARETISRRGISEEMIERFELGAAPDRNDGLLLLGRDRDISPEMLEQAGLAKQRKSGLGDMFRNRLVFPIHDQIGRVAAFGARRIDEDDIPKYLNSPESAVFDKSGTLYGLHQASRAIQRQRVAIVTEGYTDVIACHQAGFENVVATLGTALTPSHARTLRRLCETVVLLFDSDEAGAKAADRAVEVFFAQPLDVRIASLGDKNGAKDPDEVLRTDDGHQQFQDAISSGVDLLEFRYSRLREKVAGSGIATQQRALEEEVRRLGELGLRRVDPVRRQFVVRRLSEITGLSADGVVRSLRSGGAMRETGGEGEIKPSTLGDPLATMIGCMLGDTSLKADAGDGPIDMDAYRSAAMREIATTMHELTQTGKDTSLSTVLSELETEEASSLAVSLYRDAEQLCQGNDEKRRQLHLDCLKTWHRGTRVDIFGDLIQRLESSRERHAIQGANPTALPRVGGRGGQ